MKQTKNILLGGSGFIGSALVDALLLRGERVVVVARDLPEIRKNDVEYFQIDLEKEGDGLGSILGKGNIIFLLIGQVYPGFDSEKEKKLFVSVLGAVKNSEPEKVIFTSSALVYGDCEVPAHENRVVSPKDEYSVFKVTCEQMIREILPNFSVGIVRLSNVYGSEKNKGFVGLVFKKLLDESALTINSDGAQERDYIFVDDVVSGMISVRDSIDGLDTVNIATGKSHTLLQVVHMTEQVSEKVIPCQVTGVAVQEVSVSRIDITKLKEYYGFEPRVSLLEGLGKTLRRYQGITKS